MNVYLAATNELAMAGPKAIACMSDYQRFIDKMTDNLVVKLWSII